MKQIALIHIAMKVELQTFLSEFSYEVKEFGNWRFYEHLTATPYFVIVSGTVGEIETASALTYAILTYKPSAVLNGGLAGGHGLEVSLHDMVIGESCIPIASFQTPESGKGNGSNAFAWELTSYHEGIENQLNCFQADSHLLQTAVELGKKFPYKFHIGTIGSGDTWNREYDYIEYLNQTYHTLCEDMEAVAVYQTATHFRIPVLSIKCISNNEMLRQDYDRNCSGELSEFLIALLYRL